MPNWVYNSVMIDGDGAEVVELACKLVGAEGDEMSPFSFSKIVPPPASEEYADAGWYNWNINNWGTKWSACNPRVSVQRTGGEYLLEAFFDTAWDLPRGVMAALAAMCAERGLTLSWYGEEEQGWSEEWSNDDGWFRCVEKLDIPSSHADYVSRDKSCTCEFSVYRELWFDDCPQLDRASLIG